MAKSEKKVKVLYYVISGVSNFSLTEYMRTMKTRYGEYEVYYRNNKPNADIDPNNDMMKEEWDTIQPLTAEEAFKEQNMEKRRVMFSAIGPANLFKSIKPKLLDKSVLKLKNQVWVDGKKQTKEIEDVYELYSIDAKKLFPDQRSNGNTEPQLLTVRCWCTSTGREYWIFVNDDRVSRQWRSTGEHIFKDAIEAIAWTFRVGVKKSDILHIYRQGDVLVTKVRDGAQMLPENEWYHLDRETYISKLAAQS